MALAAVFLAVAVWNGVLAATEPVVWRGAAAAGCAAASAGLWYAAVVERRR
ncbi:hypothetical protein ABZ816_18515 [Actinosynnema sp. NPDC047251]|uniref:hypothetical protein n=1 Tax=Saccharothrix espanaensis TaxID=103731 RepID=UPI000302361A|nr:hypothetical protein [Saccharothrix espanaensis]